MEKKLQTNQAKNPQTTKTKTTPKTNTQRHKDTSTGGLQGQHRGIDVRILLPIADAQEKKGPAVGRKGDGGLIIKHTASLRMPGKTV